jgi:hypothetical protein
MTTKVEHRSKIGNEILGLIERIYCADDMAYEADYVAHALGLHENCECDCWSYDNDDIERHASFRMFFPEAREAIANATWAFFEHKNERVYRRELVSIAREIAKRKG